jgi:Na+-driven multidrug efflux pump
LLTGLQAGLLAQKNSVRPSIAVIVAAVTNIALDVFLIKYVGAGIRGAAVATVVSQYLSFCLLMTAYFKRDAAVRFTLTRFSLEHITQFGSCVGPIFMVIAAKNLTYLMIQSSATSLHFLLVAAHQALWSLWALCTFCCTPWEQVMLPSIKSILFNPKSLVHK